MPYELPSQQPDILLDYYERHFLRTIGDYAATRLAYVDEESDVWRALKLYEPGPESIDITDSFVEAPKATATDTLGLLAIRAKVWGDALSKEVAVDRILFAEHAREEGEIANEAIVAALVVAGRPDIAHTKLETYRNNLNGYDRKLLLEIGQGYCKAAISKGDLKAASNIVEELKVDDPVIITEKKSGIWPFRRTKKDTKYAKDALHKALQGSINGATYRLEHPQHFTYDRIKTDRDPHPYATAYREGGLSAAFGLHEYANRGLRDETVQWAYRSIAGDLAEVGELSLAYKLAQEGLVKVAQENDHADVAPGTHYDMVRYIIDGYARKHDLERAHEIATAIPGHGQCSTRVTAYKMAAAEYVQGYADELQPNDDLPAHCLETAIGYVKQHVPDADERSFTFQRIMKVLALYGQTDAIKRLAVELPPLRSTPYEHGRWPLFASHVANKDYEACVEYLEYWPSVSLTVDALTSIVKERQRRRAGKAL